MKNVLVIGAANALGHALLNLLSENEIRATAVVTPLSANKNSVPVNPLIYFIECKASELPSLENKLTEDYDTLFYLDSEDVFLSAPLSAQLAVRLKCRAFVGAGSQAELYPFEDNPYGSALLAAGKYCAALCQKAGLRFSWLRFSNLYGAYDCEDSFVSANLLSLVSGGGLILPESDANELFDLLSTNDAAHALFSTAEATDIKPFYNMFSGETRRALDFAEDMAALLCPGQARPCITEPGLSLYKNGPGAHTEFHPALSFTDNLASVIPWVQDVAAKNAKRGRLCMRIYDTAITQYDSGDFSNSLKSFFQILSFEKYMYPETLEALNNLFSETSSDFYQDNFSRNLRYFSEQALADFTVRPDERLRLYYTNDLIRLHNTPERSYLDLATQSVDYENPPSHLKASITYAGIIIDCDETFIQSLDYAEKHYADKDIYILASSQPLLLAYMQLIKFSEVELRLVKIFSSASEMDAWFRKEHSRYLPKSIISREQNLIRKLQASLDNISVFRRGIKRENSDSVILTIGIPSYNRHALLLERLKYLLSLKRDIEFEIFVSPNGWGKMCEAEPDLSAELMALNDSRLIVSPSEENILAQRNFIRILNECNGKYCFLISDEDFFNVKNFDYLIQKLSEIKDVSVYKMAGTYQGKGLQSDFYKKGADALLKFNFNNYISGTIYNRDLYFKSRAGEIVLDFVNRGNHYANTYTIPAMDMYMCLVGDVILDGTVGYIDEGPQKYYEELHYDEGIPMFYARPQIRMERQYEHYTEILLDIMKYIDDAGTIYGMFLNFSVRNFFLLSCVAPILRRSKEGLDFHYIMVLTYTRDKMKRFHQEFFPLADIKDGSPAAIYMTDLFNKSINNAARHYMDEPEKYESYFAIEPEN